MKKRTYIIPTIDCVEIQSQPLMNFASGDSTGIKAHDPDDETDAGNALSRKTNALNRETNAWDDDFEDW